MKKEVITAFFAASILTFSAMNYTSFAAESLSYAQTVKPRYSIEANTYTDLSINGGKASCYSFVEAEKVQKIVGKQTLQKQGFLWTWSTVSGATWTDKDSSNHLSMLQITNSSCAATCAAMCVNKSPETLKNDGIDLEYAMWSTIATKYGYKSTGPDSTSLKSIYNTLKSGYPVIVQVNTGSMEHWVVVTKYSGNSTTLSADDFTCIDPWDAKTKVLSSATRYSAPNKAVVFQKS